MLRYLRICQDSNATLMWACKTVLFVTRVLPVLSLLMLLLL